MYIEAEQVIERCSPYLFGDNLPEEQGRPIASGILSRYYEPWRGHHDINHVGEMVDFILPHVDDLKNPQATLWSVLGHDAVYIAQLYTTKDIPKGFNEYLSSDLTTAPMRLNFPDFPADTVNKQILSTIDHECDPDDIDTAYLIDADLLVLGMSPERFEQYDRGIQKEFGFVESALYAVGRISVLQNLNPNYLTPPAQQYTEQAKQNIRVKINELQQAI